MRGKFEKHKVCKAETNSQINARDDQQKSSKKNKKALNNLQPKETE